MNCDRCGTPTHDYNLHDYCATCSKNLCDSCMRAGCCGHTPAVSGSQADYADEQKPAPPTFDEDDVEFHATEAVPPGTECETCGLPFPE